MATITLVVNGQKHSLDADSQSPLLWICATRWGSPAPSSAVGWGCAEHAPYTSTERRSARASPEQRMLWEKR